MRPADVSGRLGAVENGQKSLLDAFEDHEQRDESRFSDLASRFEAGQSGIRGDIGRLSLTITEAISGDAKNEGLRERVRTIENKQTEREADMRWIKRMLWTTIAGLVSSVLAGSILFIATKTGTHA